MLSDPARKETAELLLKQGFIPYTKETAKNYFDGFALSYRNGLYYEENGFDDLSTEYTSTDYENFLEGEDNQFNHEKESELSYQEKSLKNPSLVFKIDEIN